MTSSRHIEFLGYLPDGTRVPNANSSSDCDGYHTRTIGPKGRFRKNFVDLLLCPGRDNLKQESPGGMYSMKRSLLTSSS